MGAGLSFESKVPLSKHLKDLLAFCGIQNYYALRKDNDKCYRFKIAFKKVCNKKQINTSQRLISQYFPEKIKHIICLNWDNLIEKAAKEHGKTIIKVNEYILSTDSSYLWKFHGDIDNMCLCIYPFVLKTPDHE
ncbi:MAG: hypothetical protein WBZ20_12360 [Nitrososphaeraceae archaeon]